jgi:biotin synthase
MVAALPDCDGALVRAGRFRVLAERVLAERPLAPDDAARVLASDDDELPALLWAAFAVRHAHYGRRVRLCVLNNARSGLCPEDCGYCSQSAVATSDIERYRMKSVDQLVAAARAAVERGARRYCMVTSARGPSDRDVGHLAEAARRIRGDFPSLELCVSLGLMDEPEARTLRTAGIDFVNHNLNTSRRFYPAICSTHTYDDRVATVQNAKRAGMSACSGVIVGLGETDDDLVDVALALRALEVDSLPVNFLHPIDGTPLGDREPPPLGRCLRALALCRLANPRADVRAAGGRERALGVFQGLSLYAASSIFVDGYLTTPGQVPAAARRMIDDLGFEIDLEPPAVALRAAGAPA